MPVYDGRVKVLVKPARYMGCKFLARTAFVPDRLWEHTFGMEGKSTKEIILPDSIFVDGVSMYYDVACSFFDAGNERRDERISLYRDARRRRIDYSADQGMLALRELYDGKSVESRALVTAYNPEYGIVWQDSVTLPCSVPLSWIVSEYEVQSATASEDIEVGKLPGELIGHRFFRWDGNVRLVVNNPAKFPFWYTICMGDKTIAKGYATGISTSRARTTAARAIPMQIAYLQGENARTIRGELPFTEKNITMEVKTAATVYPGQSAKVEVAVKDRKGRPVKNADVTAYAFTSKFEALPPEVTIYGKSASGKAITPKTTRPTRISSTTPTAGWIGRYGGSAWDSIRSNTTNSSTRSRSTPTPRKPPEGSPSYPPMWSSTGRCRVSMSCGSTNNPTISNRRSN